MLPLLPTVRSPGAPHQGLRLHLPRLQTLESLLALQHGPLMEVFGLGTWRVRKDAQRAPDPEETLRATGHQRSPLHQALGPRAGQVTREPGSQLRSHRSHRATNCSKQNDSCCAQRSPPASLPAVRPRVELLPPRAKTRNGLDQGGAESADLKREGASTVFSCVSCNISEGGASGHQSLPKGNSAAGAALARQPSRCRLFQTGPGS